MTIGEEIKRDINAVYGSTKAFSDEVGISRTTMYDIYKNGIESIGHKTLVVIANALGYDFEKFKNGEIVADPELVKRVKIPNATAKNPLEQEVIEKFRRLSIKGQLKLLDIMEDMMYVPKYQKED